MVTGLAAALISILLVVFASISILHFETVPDSNIKSAQYALWWAFVTITTVGYGDKVPFITEGRLIAGLLMTAGVGLFGTFSGFVAAWFLAPQAKQETELERLRQEVISLRGAIERQDRAK